MAEKENERVQKQLATDREIVEEGNRQFAERAKGKPTPTQNENDRAALGEHVTEKEEDGSGPDIHAEHNERSRQAAQGRSMSGEGQQRGYQTRQTAAQPGSQPAGSQPRPQSTDK